MRDILGSPCDTGSGALGTGSCSLTLKPKNQETHNSLKKKKEFCYSAGIYSLGMKKRSFSKYYWSFCVLLCMLDIKIIPFHHLGQFNHVFSLKSVFLNFQSFTTKLTIFAESIWKFGKNFLWPFHEIPNHSQYLLWQKKKVTNRNWFYPQALDFEYKPLKLQAEQMLFLG